MRRTCVNVKGSNRKRSVNVKGSTLDALIIQQDKIFQIESSIITNASSIMTWMGTCGPNQEDTQSYPNQITLIILRASSCSQFQWKLSDAVEAATWVSLQKAQVDFDLQVPATTTTPTNLALCYTPAPPSPALEVEEFDGVDKDRGEHKHPHEYHRADNRQKAVLESKLFIEILFHVDYFSLIANH